MGQVAEWKAGSAMGFRVELLAPTERIGLLGWMRSFGLGKWRVRSDEWRVGSGKSRFLPRRASLVWLGMTI